MTGEYNFFSFCQSGFTSGFTASGFTAFVLLFSCRIRQMDGKVMNPFNPDKNRTVNKGDPLWISV